MVPGGAKSQRQTDDDLIDRVRRGEARCFAELVSRYQDPVYGMALRFIRVPLDAEDVAQEAFLRAYRGLDGFKGGAQFSTWLYRITWNLCADWLRRNKKPGRTAAAVEDAGKIADTRMGVEEGFIASEEKRHVRAAIDGLDEKYRSVILLVYDQKLSYDQVGSVLQLPLKTVETRLYRARRQLRKALESAGLGGATL